MDPILRMRNRHFFALDVLALLFIPSFALTLRLDRMDWWPACGPTLVLFTVVALVVKLPVFYCLGLYCRWWRFATVDDLIRVLIAVGLSTVILTTGFAYAQASLIQYGLAPPRSLSLLDGILSCLTVGGFRLGLRGLHCWYRQRHGAMGGRRTLVVGAGEVGTLVVREMRANPQLNMEPVAFVDDDPMKLGAHIEGLQVLGASQHIPELVTRCQVHLIIVAMPSAPLGRLKEIIAVCEGTGVAVRSLPGTYELLAGYKTLSRLPDIDINRLLHRRPVEIDQTGVAASLMGATILVTGAGGSIGSELCRQIARVDPAKLILLGHGEGSIVEINLSLKLSFPDLVVEPVIADVRDRQRINCTIERCRPDVIFHAAAHKHVPFMEGCVEEALTNNVLGTWNVLQAAEAYGVERLVLISTDKAVNPSSVMGATKRLAELLTLAVARRSGRAYVAVRFGNVLGSRGSVIPIFQRQIAAGGPVTVTHPEMCRFFMTIPEAVQLVLQASDLGRGGEIFVLDMGQPVRILDLATDLIKLSGLEPGRDIEIVYTGIRPGEKLCEELFLEREDYQRTACSRIFAVAVRYNLEPRMLECLVNELVDLAQRTRSLEMNNQMRLLVNEVCCHIDRPGLELVTEPVLTLEPPRTAQVPVKAALPA
jgi:FlaA1/EpsC-like NDP-sugar epimerase